MTEYWQREIVDLHRFFERWLSGALPATDRTFARLEQALSPEFRLITPGGEWRRRAQVLESVRRGHGSRPGWRIWIENPQLLVQEGALLVAAYEEWQETRDEITVRLSTAVFRTAGAAPNGLQWVLVHETWKPQQQDRRSFRDAGPGSS